MYIYIILILIFQICYCSADCHCSPSDYVLKPYAVYLIGVTISILFFTTLVLAAILYRLKRVKYNKNELFGNNKRVSMNKYQRRVSENSQLSYHRNSVEDDTIQLNDNEIGEKYNGDDVTYRDDTKLTNKTSVKKKSKPTEPPNKIPRQPKMPIFPQMKKEQMAAICEAVLSKHRVKESTSLSDLDKMVNDAEEEHEKPKTPNLSASTPELDVFDVMPSPLPTKKEIELNSNESKLREEIRIMFNKGLVKGTKSENDQEKVVSKLNDAEINSKLVNEEIKVKQNENKSKAVLKEDLFKMKVSENLNFNLDDLVSKVISGGTEKPASECVVQDEIYDSPPPPKPNNELYDFPPSPKPHNELYDFPASPKPHNELYDLTPSHRPHSELYDITPSTRSQNDIYECPPSTRNIIVTDDDASGYLYPISDSNVLLSDEPQYTNAKSRTDMNLL